MAKLTLDDIASGYASNTKHNSNYTAIETAIENTLSRDGTSPNQMNADIDMNSNDLINVGNLIATTVTIGGSSIGDSVTAAAASAAAAATSETNASTSATNSANSATASSNSASASAVSAAVVADWDYVGNWATATEYKANNIVYVSSEGSSYVCLALHTSGTFATDLGTGKWGVLAVKGAAGAGTGDMQKSENLSGLADYTVARSNMGLAIGTNVQAYDQQLTDVAGLTPTDNAVIIGNGTNFVAESGATLKASLGLTVGTNVQAYSATTANIATEQTWTAQQTPKNGTLTDGATINWNGDTNGQVVGVTLAGNRTLAAPTNINQYAGYVLRVAQDATGSRTLTWNAAYKFAGGTDPVLSTEASKVDIFSFIGGAANTLECIGQAKAVA